MSTVKILGLSLSLLAVASACRPSADELAKQAEAAEAIDKQRARQARLDREADEKRQQERSSSTEDNSFACPMTAERALKKMASCGLNMDGITPVSLCAKLGQVKLNFMASRSCTEIDAIMFPK